MTFNQSSKENTMIDNLTIGEAKKLAAMFGGSIASPLVPQSGPEAPVIVCTDKRGVVFGYADNLSARPIVLKRARMCLYWDAVVGGVFGLGEAGPSKGSKISATLDSIMLEGVTAIFSVSPQAEQAWLAAPIQGRK